MAAALQIGSEHSGGGAGVGWQSSSSVTWQSLGNCEGAAEMRKRMGEATRRDVTRSVAAVMAILCTAEEPRSQMHGAQQTHPTGFFSEGRPPLAVAGLDEEEGPVEDVGPADSWDGAAVNSCRAPVEATGKSAALEAPCLPAVVLVVLCCATVFRSLVCSSVPCSITCTSMSSVRRAWTGWFALGGCRWGATTEFPPTADTRDVIASPVIDALHRPTTPLRKFTTH